MADVKADHEPEHPRGKKEGKLRHIVATRAKNGGIVMEHHYADNEGYTPPKTHAFGRSEHGKAVNHFMKHMGIDGEVEADNGEADE